jgi:hypothetical protein
MAPGTADGVPSFAPAACHAVASPASPSGMLKRFGGILSRAGLPDIRPDPPRLEVSSSFARISDVADPPLRPTDHSHNHPSHHQVISPQVNPPKRVMGSSSETKVDLYFKLAARSLRFGCTRSERKTSHPAPATSQKLTSR